MVYYRVPVVLVVLVVLYLCTLCLCVLCVCAPVYGVCVRLCVLGLCWVLQVASMVSGLILRGASSVSVDMGFLLEGQADEELPERMMACVRMTACDIQHVAVDLTHIL